MSVVERSPKVSDIVLLLVAGVVGLVVLSFVGCGWDTIQPGYRGIKVTMGKPSPDVIGEGLVFKMPFITKIHKTSVKQERRNSKTSAFSSDLQTIEASTIVIFRVPEKNVYKLFREVQGDPYEVLVAGRISECLKRVTATRKAEQAVKERSAIKSEVEEAVKSAVKDDLQIDDVIIENLDLTDELERAIEQKQVQEQQALAKEYELRKAQKDAEITVVAAKAEAEAVKIKGEALKSSPEVISLEIAKKWNGVAPTSVVTSAGGANILLPLERAK